MFIFNKMMYEKIPFSHEFKHTQCKEEKTVRKKEKSKSNTNLSNARQERINLYFHVYVDSSGATVQVQIIVSCRSN